MLKGLYMGLMFATFAFGILLSLVVCVPIVGLINRLAGSVPDRMQTTSRLMFTLWLGLLRVGRLLRLTRRVGKPHDGPCVMVANHPGLFDVVYLIRDIPDLSVLVKEALVRRLPLGPVFRPSGYVVAPATQSDGGVDALQQAIAVLKSGHRFLLFPEGTRSPAGGLLPFRAGAFRIARLANVPVQPILLRNLPPFLPHEDRWYYPPFVISDLSVEFWDPLPPPAQGQEREAAQALEQRYREVLEPGGAPG